MSSRSILSSLIVFCAGALLCAPALADTVIPPAGEKLLDQHHYHAAASFFDNYLQQHGSDAGGFLGRGLANAHIGQQLSAMNDFTRSISLAPTARAYVARAHLLEIQRHKRLALLDYTQAMRLEPKKPEYSALLGALYYEVHNWDKADEWYGKACALDPKNSSYWSERCRAAAKADDNLHAAEYARKAVSLSAKEYKSFEFLAKMATREEKYKEAIDYGLKGLAYNSEDEDLLIYIAESYLALKQPGTAVSFLSAQMKLPHKPSIRFRLCVLRAKAYYQFGKLELALQDYNFAIEKLMKPGDDVETYAERGLLLKKLGRLKEATADFDTAARMSHEKINDYNADPLAKP